MKKLFFAKRFLFDSIESKEFAISSLHSITVNVEESPNLAKQFQMKFIIQSLVIHKKLKQKLQKRLFLLKKD